MENSNEILFTYDDEKEHNEKHIYAYLKAICIERSQAISATLHPFDNFVFNAVKHNATLDFY